MKLTVIIPALNESDNISPTIQEIIEIVTQINDVQLELMVVDDHSTDDTFQTVVNLSLPNVHCMRLNKRSGSHVAIRAALSVLKPELAFCISADGQDDPSLLPEMIEQWKNGTQIVWGIRHKRDNESWYYQFMAYSFYSILNILAGDKNSNIDQSRADFFLLGKETIEGINACKEHHTNLFGLISWMGFTQTSIPYKRRIRRYGKSKWGILRLFHMAKIWITAFSGLPLRLTSLLGLILSFSGFLYAIYLIYNKYFGDPAWGWSSMMVAILVIGGIQLTMLGVIGEYLWINLEESRRRPLFFLEKRSDLK
ncbi:MAG: glycosyltransferase [Fibrobacteria bacterium]|nr:glycosyltransferase [Fibrobacteria bacterium]